MNTDESPIRYGHEYKTTKKERQQMHDWYMRNRKAQQKKSRDYRLKHLIWTLENGRRKNKEYRGNIRFSVLAIYSEGQLKCACCGETLIEFLTIDHIHGHGLRHLRQIRKMGFNFYNWLLKHNFPKGYRVLCMNCNFSLGHSGYCPHDFKKEN